MDAAHRLQDDAVIAVIAKAGQRWIAERFGIFTFDLELLAGAGRLQLVMRGMRCCGLPLWGALWPRIAHRSMKRLRVAVSGTKQACLRPNQR